MNKIINKLVNILCFIIGPMIIAYNLFDYRIGPGRIKTGEKPAFFYYYKEDTQILIAIGVALVCWGFLRIYWKKNN